VIVEGLPLSSNINRLNLMRMGCRESGYPGLESAIPLGLTPRSLLERIVAEDEELLVEVAFTARSPGQGKFGA